MTESTSLWTEGAISCAIKTDMSKFLVEGRPTLTVMIQARTPGRASELIQKGLAGGADAFAMQMDQLERKYRTEPCYQKLLEEMNGKPLYVTDYRTNMSKGMSDEELAEELLVLAKCGAVLIDVMGDLYGPSKDEIATKPEADAKQRALINKIHSYGAEVLMSSHTYRFLTVDEVLKMAKIQADRGADIIKIVTAANTEKELYHNFEITARLKRELEKPFLFLCTGEYCKKHRLMAPMMTNDIFLCVAEHDKFSTPAQPLLKTAKQFVNFMYGG